MSKRNVVWWTTILTSMVRSGNMKQADWAFNAMPQWDLAPWNLLITAYARLGHLQDAIDLFQRAPCLNVITWTAMIQAYSNNSQAAESKRLFDTMGQRNAVAWTTTMVGYAQNGHLDWCLELFQRMPFWDVFSCTAMLDVYSQNGLAEEALFIFKTMKMKNSVTWISMLYAFAQHGYLQKAVNLYRLLPEICVVSSTVILMAFSQGGDVHSARDLFQCLPERDIGVWNAMLAVNAQNGEELTALKMFKLIDLEGLNPNKLTYIHTLDACTRVSALQEGKTVHTTMSEELLTDIEVRTALLNLYSKCGALHDAHELFKGMAARDMVCWSSMIAAYARNGHSLESLETFHAMVLDGVLPQLITFISILSACSHGGLCKQGIAWFVSMQEDFNITPGLELFRCMIDLFGRSGHINEAEDLASNMPFEPDTATWRSFLGACRLHPEGGGGKYIERFDPNDAATRILLLSLQT